MVIRNNVHPDNWKYCTTNENPADIKMWDISLGTSFLKKHG